MPCARAMPAVMKLPRIAVAIRIENLDFCTIITSPAIAALFFCQLDG